MSGKGAVHPLHGNQMHAVAPQDTVWLSASAGTGKTQVLSSRVLRLLLQPDVQPSQILCLTFTKAGAAEMAERINGTLASWVRLPETDLFQRLQAIGAPCDPETRDRARTLFAAVLDCPGGGLRIDTIHAFSQWLLGAFPLEAGLLPGARAMEDRDRLILARQVLSDLLVDAEQSKTEGGEELTEALNALSERMPPEAVETYLLRCAGARDAWFGVGAFQEPLRPRILSLLGLPQGISLESISSNCDKSIFDEKSLRKCFEAWGAWKGKTRDAVYPVIAEWLSTSVDNRLEQLDALSGVLFTKDGKVARLSSLEKFDPSYEEYALKVKESIERIQIQRALMMLADDLEPALRLGRAFSLAWETAKEREGLIDFDDQIRRAAALLNNSTYSQWINYKLDRRFDHILVDEAQDTNADQWQIINALTAEFFVGEGQHAERLRTLFVVGDYKQAIFRFQGTSPENFEAARRRVRAVMHHAAENEVGQRGAQQARSLLELGLDRSFRTAQSILDFVDLAIQRIGHNEFGLTETPEAHQGENRPGSVVFWHPVGAAGRFEADEDEEKGNWISRPERLMADRIAQQVRAWMDEGFPLVKGGARRAGPGDIMILVRKRKELASLIVARLHAAGVPVAGVDRLRLAAPLAVRDLVAALRFAAQPLDDLNLASLLVSPLIGWSQEQLLAHGYREKRVPLWEHLRRTSHEDVVAVMAYLLPLLAKADYELPQNLLEWILVGPWQGRAKLVARLGVEASDPIDELLNATQAFSSGYVSSLVGFLNWFDMGEGELKREAGASSDLVRVMTVHGSKGLQAPIVILADATGNPEAQGGRQGGVDLPDVSNPDRKIPLVPLNKHERVGRIAEEVARTQKEELQEHWRLLYVAMTRAEEALLIGGALGSREKEPAANSWYKRLFDALPAEVEALENGIWGAQWHYGDPLSEVPALQSASPIMLLPLPEPLPRWLKAGAPAEPRPPKPLAPSSLGEDTAADPPYPPGAGLEAARRGVLIHKLLERLPMVSIAQREEKGSQWLERQAKDLSQDIREKMMRSVLNVLENPDWADIFGTDSLAEVPIAAVIGERVVAGTIDRLWMNEDCIRIIDYKTARRPPERTEDIPKATLQQMSAYAAALTKAYPERRIEAAVLYTATPLLLPIASEILEAGKNSLIGVEESL